MNARKLISALALVALPVAGFAAEANAAPVTRTQCSVLGIFSDSSSTSQSHLFLDVQCAEGRFSVNGYSGAACTPAATNVSGATLETWRSLSQAVWLAGKKMTVNYDSTSAGGCSNALYSIHAY